ncbi:uncharacterized protein LOC128964472 [Oppia nitens]|uniref:uncharacterized protein LOC128964472 n=1 Tax=Oppia nitens TaxID=1686743 RepID=UPI0023DAD849|nr:uncharacterized protein LOC128964472 [Oppia nitens]
MPLISYRGSGSGARFFFGVSTREFLRPHTYGQVNKNPIYGSIIVITSIILVTVFLLLAPNSVQPQASYIAFSLLLILPLVFILVILFNQFKRKYLAHPVPDIHADDMGTGSHHPFYEFAFISKNDVRRHSSQSMAAHNSDHKLSISSSPTPSKVYTITIPPPRRSPSF